MYALLRVMIAVPADPVKLSRLQLVQVNSLYKNKQAYPEMNSRRLSLAATYSEP